MSIGTWIKTEEEKIAAVFTNEEAAIMQFLAPLGKQILAAAKALGTSTVQEGVQVILNSAIQAAQAGAQAQATGGNAVTAAETAFVSTATAQGITVIHNAEAGAIKAAVAIVQANASTAAAALQNAAPQTGA